MSGTEQQYKDQIKELEQRIRLLKEQVDFLPRKLFERALNDKNKYGMR